MNNIAVIYKSKHGTTKQYAQWIAEELGASLFEASSIKHSQVAVYDTVIYGGGLYAGGIDGIKLVTKNRSKSLIVFTVGLADPNTTDYADILTKNFTQEQLSKTKVFHLRGGIDYKKLGVVDKSLMAILRKMAAKKKQAELSDEDKVFLDTYGGKLDFTNQPAIKPLVDYVRAL